MKKHLIIAMSLALGSGAAGNAINGMLVATVVLGTGLVAAGVVHAKPQGNACWGQSAKVFQAVGKPGMGDHTSSHSFFTPNPGDGGRRGVGNVTNEDFGPVSKGGQGVHGATVLKQFADFNDDPKLFESLPEECQELALP